MSKAIVLGLALFVASAMVQAQDQSPQSSPQSTAPSTQTTPDNTQQPATPAPDQTAPTQQPVDNGNGTMQNSQQSPDVTGPNKNSTSDAQASAKPASTTGCVRISVDHFVLTDDSGKMYNLAGDTSNLNSDVGHKVQVTGVVDNTSSVSTNTTTPQGSNESQRPTITVQQVQSLGDTCSK